MFAAGVGTVPANGFLEKMVDLVADPVSCETMLHAVIDVKGHSLSREMIEALMKRAADDSRNRTVGLGYECPLGCGWVKQEDLRPNLALQDIAAQVKAQVDNLKQEVKDAAEIDYCQSAQAAPKPLTLAEQRIEEEGQGMAAAAQLWSPEKHKQAPQPVNQQERQEWSLAEIQAWLAKQRAAVACSQIVTRALPGVQQKWQNELGVSLGRPPDVREKLRHK